MVRGASRHKRFVTRAENAMIAKLHTVDDACNFAFLHVRCIKQEGQRLV